jgi:hypothetical protein
VSAPDVRQAYAVEVLSAMLTPSAYAARHDLGHRTVQRYLEQGRLEGAVKDDDGRWRIPADAQVVRKSATTVVRQAASDVAPPTPDVRLASPLGALLTLEDVAAALGTNVWGVRRLADAGHLVVGPFGPYGALRVYVAPR